MREILSVSCELLEEFALRGFVVSGGKKMPTIDGEAYVKLGRGPPKRKLKGSLWECVEVLRTGETDKSGLCCVSLPVSPLRSSTIEKMSSSRAGEKARKILVTVLGGHGWLVVGGHGWLVGGWWFEFE